jgi:putative phosphoesterase
MRIALISDIHANLVALDAALDDISRRSVDQVVCLGDIADLGPAPAATLTRLQRLGYVCVQGNHDPFTEHFPGLEPVVAWCQAQLSEQQLAFLSALPSTHTVELSPGVELLCVHGSPQSYDTQFIQTTTDDDLRGWQVPHSVVATVCGHTHVQLVRRVDSKTYVNVGSVGAPFVAPFDGRNPPRCLKRIEYGIVEWREGNAPGDGTLGVELVSLPLDFGAYEGAIRAGGFPDPDGWLRQWG